ncbi:hypothetical protein SeMB42_g00808 [Synchytrium endobioticum]|uniref:RRM domain-containing protein n=1 Tax=Synchytrium endobioticum TaxID=286115 RepID=A0A507DJG3_9FUNG|nr:hypothetical protein SeLEV6574_g00017 [Synchytrium endobioticum]TPX53421.1 hypothetical protein SeMB42_g00808 [Synchytrium endobioticum]
MADNINQQPSSASPLVQTSPATAALPQTKQHLFSSFSPSFNFYDNSDMDASDEIASDHSQVTSADSDAELISAMRDVAIDKPRSSRFTWLEPQEEPEHSESPLAPQLPLGSLIQPEPVGRKESPRLEQQQNQSRSKPGTPIPGTPPRYDVLHPGTLKSASTTSTITLGQITPSETPTRSWPRDSADVAVDSSGRRMPSTRSSPRLARSLFTPPFTPRTYNRSNLGDDTPSPRSTSSLQDYLLDSLATTIQEDVDFPLNELHESFKAVSVSAEGTASNQQPQLLKPTRIIVLEGVDEDLAFDELRAALMANGEIRHLSVVYSTTCICVYYNIGAAIDAYNHIRQYGLAHQHKVTISFGDQATLRRFGPVPEDLMANQGALIVWNHVGLNLLAVMSKFGEIRFIKDHDLCPSEASVVEFHDVRCAKRAFEYIQQYHGDSLFVEYKNPMRKTWNPSTKDVAPPTSSKNTAYFSPSLLDLEFDPLFSLSPSHVNNERRIASPLASSGNYHSAGYNDDMLLSTPDRDYNHNTTDGETPRRPSRPKVPSIVTTFGLGDSPVSQRQQQLQQMQHESGRGIDSPLYVGSSPMNYSGATHPQQVASPTTHINAKSSYAAANASASDLILYSTSAPIDIHGRRKAGSTSSLLGSSVSNNNGSRTRLFSNNSLGDFSSSPLSSSPFGMMAMNDSLWSYSRNSDNQPLLSSKLQQLQQGSSGPLSAPAISSSSVWNHRHSSHDSPISPLMVSPLHGNPLGSSPLVNASNTSSVMSTGHNIRTGDFDLARVVAGLDNRTTFMIKNLPNKYTQQMLIDFLNETHRGEYDFLYVRIDFINRCNVGYAFINFANPGSVISFAERVVGKRWPKFNSTKVCTLSYAKIQGLDALIRKFRDSSVMLEEPAFRPKIFYTSGPSKGEEAPFPPPTVPLRPSTRGLYSKTHGYIHGNDGIGNNMDSPTAVLSAASIAIQSASIHARHSSATSISTTMTARSNASSHSNNSGLMDVMPADAANYDDEMAGSGLIQSCNSLGLLDAAN